MRKVKATITERDRNGDKFQRKIELDEVESIEEAIQVLGAARVLKLIQYAHSLHQRAEHYKR